MTQQEIDQLPELLRRKQVMLLMNWTFVQYRQNVKRYGHKIAGLYDPRTPKRALLQLIKS